MCCDLSNASVSGFSHPAVAPHPPHHHTPMSAPCRWLKYEERVEEGERWSKPHVGTASLHALFRIRKRLADQESVVCLDLKCDRKCTHDLLGE